MTPEQKELIHLGASVTVSNEISMHLRVKLLLEIEKHSKMETEVFTGNILNTLKEIEEKERAKT